MKATSKRGSISTDILVLMPCIVILLVLLLPAVRSAKEKAMQAQCMSNLKNIVNAMFTFEAEHGRLPMSGKCGRNLESDWTWGGNVVPVPQTDPATCERVQIEKGVLWPYVMGMERAAPYGGGRGMREEWYASPKRNPYLCPDAGAVGRKRGLSYSMNCRLDVSLDGGGVAGTKLTQIRHDSRTILLVDESELTLNDGSFDPDGVENKSPELHAKHAGGGNIAFCDGHVAWLEKQKLVEIMGPKSDFFSPSE
jgi:prepilin-type processing-associated H-X9-DG protein